MLVALQPAADPDAQEHYRGTIESPVNLAAVTDLTNPSDRRALATAHPSGAAAMWGVTPGGRNATQWAKLTTGDVVLFYADKRFFATAVVTHVFRNAPLASHLWGRDDAGRTWEHMFALRDVHALGLPVEDFNALLGYAPNAIVQGFRVLDGERSDVIAEVLGAEPSAHVSAVASTFDKDPDGTAVVHVRREQSALRGLLLEIGRAHV